MTTHILTYIKLWMFTSKQLHLHLKSKAKSRHFLSKIWPLFLKNILLRPTITKQLNRRTMGERNSWAKYLKKHLPNTKDGCSSLNSKHLKNDSDGTLVCRFYRKVSVTVPVQLLLSLGPRCTRLQFSRLALVLLLHKTALVTSLLDCWSWATHCRLLLHRRLKRDWARVLAIQSASVDVTLTVVKVA